MAEPRQEIPVTETSTILLRELAEVQDAGVWTRFVAAWSPRLRTMLSRRGVRSEAADEAVQAALIKIHVALRKQGYIRSRGRLSAWMKSITVRAAHDLQRDEARRRARNFAMESAETGVADTPPGEASLEAKALLERARLLVARDQRDARIFEALIIGGEPPASVAKELNLSVEHVYLIKHRLVRRLRESLARRES